MNIEILEKVVKVRALVESESNPGSFYKVVLNKNNGNIFDCECSCKGFHFKGTCKHFKEVMVEAKKL